MEGPKISVIIPVYNVEKYLPACLDSVIRQSYTSLELILVDDGSSDRSLEICRSYAERDDRIRVIRRDNGGASAARNTGLDHASGEYVSFVDSDDILFPDALEKLYQMVLREKTALAVGGFLEWYKNRMRPITPIRGSFTVETEEAVRLALEGKKSASICSESCFKDSFSRNIVLSPTSYMKMRPFWCRLSPIWTGWPLPRNRYILIGIIGTAPLALAIRQKKIKLSRSTVLIWR